MRIAVIGCKKKKQDYCCSANEMYSKAHSYVAQRNFIELAYDDYFIFSSKYGIIHHTEHICPYDISIYADRTTTNTISQIDTEFITNSVGSFLSKYVDKTIHFHTSIPYVKYALQFKYNNIKHIKQQVNVSLLKKRYDEAVESYKQNQDLELALDIVMAPTPKNPESPQWWVHPLHDKFYGTSYELWKYSREFQPTANQGNLREVGFGRKKSQLGWRLDKSGIRRVAMGVEQQHKGWKIDDESNRIQST